jgi:hypothetical protein
MHAVLDLGSELLVDRSAIRDPYVRLLATVVGEALAHGSPWVAVGKRAATARRPVDRANPDPSGAHGMGRDCVVGPH